MGLDEPKQAVIEGLRNYSNLSEEAREVLQQQGFIAKASTVRFLKKLCIPYYQLHVVQYETTVGDQRTCLCFLQQQESSLWQLTNTLGLSFPHPSTREEQNTSQPWVSLGAHWGVAGTLFWAGGHIIDHGFGVRWVRLIGSNGLVLEDQVEYGFVLFLSDQEMQRPVKAELYNRSDLLVGKQTVFPSLP